MTEQMHAAVRPDKRAIVVEEMKGAADGQPGAACAAPQTSLVIYDLATGRLKSGHQEDYLTALEEALEEY